MSFEPKKILVMGLSGAGKTTLARILAPRLNAVNFNADGVRANVNKDLGYSREDRTEQARRMGWLCDRVIESGNHAIADFICPTQDAREAFGASFVVWVDRIKASRFADTDQMFEEPASYDVRVAPEGSPLYWADKICDLLLPASIQRRQPHYLSGATGPSTKATSG